MNLLVDPLPEAVAIGDNVYPISTDFRVSILFELMMQDATMSPEERMMMALDLYFPGVSDIDPVKAFETIIWFYKCGKEKMEDITRRNNEALSDEECTDQPHTETQAYSFEYDDAYIYAAFMEYYGIDLTEADLHWWKFRALFRALPDDATIVKIMGYRVARITDKMSKGEKDFLRKMKKAYRLPLSDAEQEYNAKLTEALMNGGDLTGLV